MVSLPTARTRIIIGDYRTHYLSKACVRLAQKADLQGVRLHDLRHTQASLLIQQGEYPKVISERLWHASTAFTNDLYGHLMPGMEQAAAAKVGAALEGVISAPE